MHANKDTSMYREGNNFEHIFNEKVDECQREFAHLEQHWAKTRDFEREIEMHIEKISKLLDQVLSTYHMVNTFCDEQLKKGKKNGNSAATPHSKFISHSTYQS